MGKTFDARSFRGPGVGGTDSVYGLLAELLLARLRFAGGVLSGLHDSSFTSLSCSIILLFFLYRWGVMSLALNSDIVVAIQAAQPVDPLQRMSPQPMCRACLRAKS